MLYVIEIFNIPPSNINCYSNGVKQGGYLSNTLFNVYLNVLIDKLRKQQHCLQSWFYMYSSILFC